MMHATQPPMPPAGGDMMNKMPPQTAGLASAGGLPRGSPFQTIAPPEQYMQQPPQQQLQQQPDLLTTQQAPQLSAFNPPPSNAFLPPPGAQQAASISPQQMYQANNQFARPALQTPPQLPQAAAGAGAGLLGNSVMKPPSAFNYPQGQQPLTQPPPQVAQYQNGAQAPPPAVANPQAFQQGPPPQQQQQQMPAAQNLAQQMSNMSINNGHHQAPPQQQLPAFNNVADHAGSPPTQAPYQPPLGQQQQPPPPQMNQYNPAMPSLSGPGMLPQPNQMQQQQPQYQNGQLPNQYNPQAPPQQLQQPQQASMMQPGMRPMNPGMAPPVNQYGPPQGNNMNAGPPLSGPASLAGPTPLYNMSQGGMPSSLQRYPTPSGLGTGPAIGQQPPNVMQQPTGMMGQPMQPPQPGQYMPQQQQPQFDQMNQQQQAGNSRMDMDAMPHPIDVMNVNTAKYGGSVFETNEPGKLPPLTSTDFTCRDMGNCNPRFIRSSVYSIPANPDLIKQSKMPIAIALTPFAELRKDEREPPISDLGELGPVRCKRCKAYMSPFMQFIDNGRRFQCPFCEDATQVPQEYFNHLDHMGKRIDQYERPELSCGSYEFVANKDYCRNQTLPKPPAFIFMIDVSVNSVRSGLLHVLCPYLKNVVLPNLPRDHAVLQQLQAQNPNATAADVPSSIRVGFVTYDKELHFYNLKSTLAAPQMMIVSDVEEVFVPMLDGFLVSLHESKAVIDALLDSLPGMFAESKETEIVLAPVVEAGLEALKAAKCAGKLFVFHTNLPNCLAPGQLKNRDDKKLLGTDKEKSVLSPQNEYYAQLGKRCVENGCGVDLFLLPNQHCDVATLADLTRKVAGQIYKYDFFMADSHGQRLCEDLKYAVESTVAFDAVMKVRTSTGIKPNDYLGNFNMYGNDIEFASLYRQYSLSVELKHEDKMNENAKVYIQAALLYTSVSGQRRIRLHNLALNVCTQYNQMYPSCEVDALINYMAKLAARSVTVSTPKSINENLVQQVSHILACYRKNCTNAPSKGQFILPETLKLLPLFANSLLKSDPISGAQTVSVDERAWLLYRLMSMDIQSTYALFYPRLFPVHEMQSPDAFPNQIRCLYEKLKDDGIYLLENGLTMYLWLGQNVDPATIQNLFGVSGVQLNVEKCKLLEIDTPISKNVRSLIRHIQEHRKASMKLVIVRQRDSLEPFFKNYLVEDMGFKGAGSSYVDFLYLLHKEIKNILS